MKIAAGCAGREADGAVSGLADVGFVTQGRGQRSVDHEAAQLAFARGQEAVRAAPGTGQFDRHQQPMGAVLGARKLEFDDLDVHLALLNHIPLRPRPRKWIYRIDVWRRMTRPKRLWLCEQMAK